MALEQKVIDLIAEAIKSAQTVYFDPDANSICVFQLSRLGSSLHAQTLSYTACSRTDLEFALDESGMLHSNHEGRDGIIVFEIKDLAQKASPEMSLEDALSTLPWSLIVVDKNSNETTLNYGEARTPFSRSHKKTFSCDLETVLQALKARGQQYKHDDPPPFADHLDGHLVFIRRTYLLMNA